MYQETLARALAQHFQCNLLVFDPAKIAPLDASEGRGLSPPEPRAGLSVLRHNDSFDDDADLWQLDGKDRRPFRKGAQCSPLRSCLLTRVCGRR
jgi:hypothetical protein